jgi:hypothetical protein
MEDCYERFRDNYCHSAYFKYVVSRRSIRNYGNHISHYTVSHLRKCETYSVMKCNFVLMFCARFILVIVFVQTLYIYLQRHKNYHIDR